MAKIITMIALCIVTLLTKPPQKELGTANCFGQDLKNKHEVVLIPRALFTIFKPVTNLHSAW